MQTYRLSNRQQKELVIRGQVLTVAIPVPWDEPDDLVSFARESLLELPADVDIVAEDGEVCVSLPPMDAAGGQVTAILGHIDGLKDGSQIAARIAVVVATLTPPRSRGRVKSVQWPGGILE